MMGGLIPKELFDSVINGLNAQDRQSLSRQMDQQMRTITSNTTNQWLLGQAAAPVQAVSHPVTIGPGLLPKDLIPMLDFEYADNIPARIAAMVQKLIETRSLKAAPVRQQLGFNQLGGMRWATATAHATAGVFNAQTTIMRF